MKIKPNLNFHNEYDAVIQPEDREKALSLFKKMSLAKPGLIQSAEVSIKDEVDGSMYIFISNVSAFDKNTEIVIKKFLNQLNHKQYQKRK